MKYIGLDAHISSCTFHVLDADGKSLDGQETATTGSKLVSYLRGISGEKTLCFEETNLARWLYAILKKEVDHVVVCDPVMNHLMSQGPKNDKVDAKKLAQLVRGGFVNPVFHSGDEREEFRDLVGGYDDLIRDFVRLKNRYKALFRSQGVRRTGGDFYEEKSFLKDLQKRPARFVGKGLYETIVFFEERRKEYVSELQKQSRKFPEIRLLKTIPGIGVIHACKIVAAVVSPDRFQNKYKFFSYCGLVKHQQESGGRSYGLRTAHSNRTLKGVFRMAGHTVVRGKSALRKEYDRMMSKGISSHAAYNAVCRRIAALSLILWKNGEKYKDDYVKDSSKKKIQS
jgi:transposase